MADAQAARGPARRDWRVAAGLSVVPGLGQLYNGQPRKGLFFLLATVLTIGPGVLLITFGERVGHGLIERRAFGLFLLLAFVSVLVFLVLVVLGLFMWASAAADARRTALSSKASGDAPAKVSFFRF
jgi:arabinogalactan oligomer/maltooligosaccharide transport system permease protein